MLNGIENIFEKRDIMLKHLKKKSFEENTEFFKNQYGYLFDEMFEYVGEAEDKEAAANDVAQVLVEAVTKKFAVKKDKISGRDQVDLNFFMIYYVFPTILSYESANNKLLADTICDKWGSSFKDSRIQYTDYDSLYGSFRHKIIGIF